MTTEEIIKGIKDNDLQIFLFNLSDMEEYLDQDASSFESIEALNEKLKELELDSIEEVASVCNSDEMYVILHLKSKGVYLRLTGEYDSYGGGDHYYDGPIKEVFPKQETITTYN